MIESNTRGLAREHSPEDPGNPSGRGSARLERTVRVREVGGSNPPAPTAEWGCPKWTAPSVFLLTPYLVYCALEEHKDTLRFAPGAGRPNNPGR